MSEGFAEMSASLYLTLIEKDQKQYLKFWSDERELLLERDAQGYRAIDAGPLTMGYRTNNSRTGGGITRRLIYPKGAYVLQMIRMMMFDTHTGINSLRRRCKISPLHIAEGLLLRKTSKQWWKST